MQQVIVIVSFIMAAASFAHAQQAAATDPGGYEVIANAFGFGVDIPECPEASKNVREIAMDDLIIDAREMTTGPDVEYRQYAPGHAHFGNIQLKTAVSPNDPCLNDWLAAARAGKNIRKNITVALFKSDKTPGRSYLLHDTFPIALSTDTADPGLAVLTVQVGGVTFDGGSAQLPRGAASANRFAVQVFGKNMTPVLDGDWESCTGGAQTLEVHPASFGAPADTKRSCTEVTLRGPMTTSRGWLAGLLNEVAGGAASQVVLLCGGVKAGKQYVYLDSFPVGYVFPRMSVTNTSGNVIEEVRIKPVRCELK